MSVQLLHTLGLIAYILAGIFFLIALVLFFHFRILELIGDISGANAKRAIESIRQQNASSGDKAYRPSRVNLSRGKLTDRMTPSGNLRGKTKGIGVGVGTEKISTEKLVSQGEETTVLTQGAETTVLAQGSQETTILPQNDAETTILSQETTILYEQQEKGELVDGKEKEFSVEVDMSFMVSEEIIE